MFKEISGYFT